MGHGKHSVRPISREQLEKIIQKHIGCALRADNHVMLANHDRLITQMKVIQQNSVAEIIRSVNDTIERAIQVRFDDVLAKIDNYYGATDHLNTRSHAIVRPSAYIPDNEQSVSDLAQESMEEENLVSPTDSDKDLLGVAIPDEMVSVDQIMRELRSADLSQPHSLPSSQIMVRINCHISHLWTFSENSLKFQVTPVVSDAAHVHQIDSSDLSTIAVVDVDVPET